jgi:hypothetical protein
VNGFLSDVGHAARRLRKSPGFTIFSVITLALGIGSVTAIYSVVETVTGPPPGISNADQVFEICRSPTGSVPMVALSWPEYQEVRARQTAFEKVMGWTRLRQAISADGVAKTGGGELVDGDDFSVLGIKAILGRMVTPNDDLPGAPPVAIGHSTWQQMFSGTREVIGKAVKVNGLNVQIVGVAPREFSGLFNGGIVQTMMWLPMNVAPGLTGPGLVDFDPASRTVERSVALPSHWGIGPLRRVLGVPDQLLQGPSSAG